MCKKFLILVVLLACTFCLYAQDARAIKIDAIKRELSIYMAAHKGSKHAPEIEQQIQQQLNSNEHGHELTIAQKKKRQEALNAFFWENQFWKAHPEYEAYVSQRDVEAMANLCENGSFEDGNNAFTHSGSMATGGSNNCAVAGTIPFNPTIASSSTSDVPNRMELVTAANDPLVAGLRTARTGNRALRINSRRNAAGQPCTPDLQNINFNSEIDKASTTFTVSSDATTLSFWFAVVMQFPDHVELNGRNPFFTARLRDHNTNTIQTICLDPSQNNMLSAGTVCLNPLVWQPWRCGVFDLSNSREHQVTLEFLAADCLFQAHFGYAYIDDICIDCDSPSDLGNVDITTADDCFTNGVSYSGTFILPAVAGSTLSNITVLLRQNGSLLSFQTATIAGNTFSGTFPANLFVDGNMYDLIARATFNVPGVGTVITTKEIMPGINNDFKATKEGCCDITDKPDFTIQTNCNNGVFTVALTANDTDPMTHIWNLYQTSAPAVSGGVLAATSSSGATATFNITDFSKFYYVTHGIVDDCYTLREAVTSITLPQANFSFNFADALNVPKTTFCFGETIKLNATMGTNVTGYYIDAWRRPIGNNAAPSWYAGLGWFSGQPSMVDLTAAFSGLANPAYFEPGYEYEIKLAVTNPNLCIGWSEKLMRFKVECCAGFFKPCFQLDPEPNLSQQSNSLWVRNFNTYWATAGAVHEWYVLSSPNPSGGPYTLVNIVTSTGQTDVLVYSNAQYGVQYKVIHKLKTKCGEFCCAQSDCANCKGADVVQEVDCRILDSLSCSVPAGLAGSCSRGVLVWNPVLNASGYVVEISYNDPACCRSPYAPVGARYEVKGTSLLLGSIILPRYDCFRWRVMTKCANGATSAWSEWKCYSCKGDLDDGGGSGQLFRSITGSTEVETKFQLSPTVLPNPNKGDMTLSMQAPGDLVLSVDVIDAQGSRVKTIARKTCKGGTFNTQLSLGAAAKGVYTVVFNTNYGTFRKKVIVQ
jgi:Secretion system C-terminal sorting domain